MTCPTKPIDLLLGKKSVRVCAKPVQVTGCNTLCGTLHCQYFIVLYFEVIFCTVMYCTIIHCIVLY